MFIFQNKYTMIFLSPLLWFLRGHVNNKKFQKDFGSGRVGQVSKLKKKIGKHIFIHYFITFLGEHSNVNNVINGLLCCCSCVYVQVFLVNYF